MNIFERIGAKKDSNEFSDSNKEDEFTDDGKAYFERYLDSLKLSDEDLKKTILDVGSHESTFADWAKRHNVSKNIFSLDPWFISRERTKAVQGMSEAIPFKDESFDIVVSNCAIPNIFLEDEDVEEKTRLSLFEMFRVTKPGGEIRLGNVGKGELYLAEKERTMALNKVLKELERDLKAEVEQVHVSELDYYEPAESEFAGELYSPTYFIKIKKPKTPTGQSV